MKIKVNVMLLIVLSFFALATAQPVNAEEEQSVQSIIEQVQEHNLREEEVQEELEQLPISELKDIQEYLANKHDVTMIENQVLNLTQELLSNGDSVKYVAQENLNAAERKEELREEVEEFVDGLSKKERNSLRQELGSIRDKSTEEKVMYHVLSKIYVLKILSYILIKGAVLIAVGALIKLYDKRKGDPDSLSGALGNTLITFGAVLIVVVAVFNFFVLI